MVWVFANQVNKDFACIVEFEVQEKSKSPVITETFPEITILDDEQVLYISKCQNFLISVTLYVLSHFHYQVNVFPHQ